MRRRYTLVCSHHVSVRSVQDEKRRTLARMIPVPTETMAAPKLNGMSCTPEMVAEDPRIWK
jgi:hypothetical protein